MSSKTKNKRNSPSIIKNGTATSILSGCDKPFIADNLTDYRDKYYRINTQYEKLEQKLKASEQDSKEKLRLIAELQKKNDTINKLHTTITQRDNEIKTLKDISVHRNEVHVLEGKIKKRDHIIKELEKQISETKINNLEHLKNTIHQQNEQIKYLKEGYGKFNVEDESLKEENTQYRMEIDKLKDDLNLCKASHKRLIEKLDKFQKVITNLYDDF